MAAIPATPKNKLDLIEDVVDVEILVLGGKLVQLGLENDVSRIHVGKNQRQVCLGGRVFFHCQDLLHHLSGRGETTGREGSDHH